MSDKYTSTGTIIRDNVEHGCHLELGDGEKPDQCVIDSDDHWACIYATFKNGHKRRTQWTCKHWKPV